MSDFEATLFAPKSTRSASVRVGVRVALACAIALAATACSDSTSATSDAGPDVGDDADAAVETGDLGDDADAGDLGDESGDLPDASSDLADGDAHGVVTASISDVLTCGTPASAGGLNRGDELQRVDVDQAAFPDAVCNDGTGAVFYFRPYAGEDNANRWVIQLQGGGGCRTPDSCAQRWCSVDTNFGMTQMTADLAPQGGINGAGILARRADNPVGDYNHVFVRYCSSDSWAGTARDVVVTATDPDGGDPVEMRLEFAGSLILDAVLDTLRADGVGALEYTLGDGAEPMPDLDDAEIVLLAGASAGGGGVVNNADRVRELLRATNADCGAATCNLAYRVLIDSHFGPDRERLEYASTPFCLEAGLCSYEAHMEAESAFARSFAEPRVDSSCLAFHEATADTWRCDDDNHVMEHHLTSPMFVRMGQTDQLISGNTIDAGFGYGGEPLDVPTFARLVREQLAALAELQSSAEEGDEIPVAPGSFGPTCSKHETLRSNPDTFNVAIRQDDVDYRMFDVLTNWVLETEPSGVIAESQDANVCP